MSTSMIHSTDVFAFKSKLNELLNTVYTNNLTKEEKSIAFFYLNQVIEIAEHTLKL